MERSGRTEADGPGVGDGPAARQPGHIASGAWDRASGLRNYLPMMLRGALSLLLLVWVLGRADWSGVVEHLDDADWLYLTLFLLITPVNVGISVYKWRILLTARGSSPPFWLLFQMYVASQFYNTFLPSTVGGDTVRALMLNRIMAEPRHALGSIVMERLTGLLVLTLLGGGVAWAAPQLHANRALMILVAVSILASVGLFVAVLSRRVIDLLRRLFGSWQLARQLLAKADGFQRALHEYRHSPDALAFSLLLSCLFYVGVIVNIWLVCAGIGQSVSWSTVAIVVPVVLLVSLLPVTVGGLGLTEWTFMVGFQALGVPGALGVAASLLLRAKQLIWSSGGYLVYQFGAGRAPAAQGHASATSAEPS